MKLEIAISFKGKNILSQEQLKFFEKYIDLGDFLEAQGSLFATQRGEKSLLVKKFTLLAKSLRPLPTEWFGLEDTEERFRKRYLDLLENEEVRTRFSWRSKIISEIRNFFESARLSRSRNSHFTNCLWRS